MAKADVGEELRQRRCTSEDLNEHLEEESKPIHHSSPHLQRPRRREEHLCVSHALHDPPDRGQTMIEASRNEKATILLSGEKPLGGGRENEEGRREKEEVSGALREHAGDDAAQFYWLSCLVLLYETLLSNIINIRLTSLSHCFWISFLLFVEERQRILASITYYNL